MTPPRTKTATLVHALYNLAATVQSGDGVANAALNEAAKRLDDLDPNDAINASVLEIAHEFALLHGGWHADMVIAKLRSVWPDMTPHWCKQIVNRTRKAMDYKLASRDVWQKFLEGVDYD